MTWRTQDRRDGCISGLLWVSIFAALGLYLASLEHRVSVVEETVNQLPVVSEGDAE